MSNEVMTSIPQKLIGTEETSPSSEVKLETKLPPYHWMVKPCFIYKEEYKDCKSFKARFHQYFVDGKSSDCRHWKEDYDNCLQWEENDNLDALKTVIESEKERARTRIRNHYANNVWEHRTEPPPDWNKELPDSIKKEYENSYLKKKADELRNGEETLGGNIRGNMGGDGDDRVRDKSSCSIS